MMVVNTKQTFEDFYFSGWFKHAVGNFSPSDLQLSQRWFWGWLAELNKHVDVMHGQGRSVLEIGCSIGGVSTILHDRGFAVTATDISKMAIAGAKKLSPEIDYRILDVQKPIALKKKFDLVFAFEVVEHLKYPEKAIGYMRDVLKPNGTLVISTPYPYPWIFRDPTHIAVKYPEEWVEMLKRQKLQNVAYHRFSVLPYFYRYNKYFHFRLPFAIPLSFINSPIFFLGTK